MLLKACGHCTALLPNCSSRNPGLPRIAKHCGRKGVGAIGGLAVAQVAAELGAKPPMSTCDLTAEEEASIATDIDQQAHSDGAAYAGQQLRLEGSSHGSPLGPTVSSQPAQSSGSQGGEDTVHAQHPSSSSDTLPSLVPTHSYRHGMLQRDRPVDRNDSTRDDAAAELQPA